MAREDVRRGIKAVGAAGLAYDLLPKQRELPACLPAVDANPDMRFVVDHIAKPLIAAGEIEPWKACSATPPVKLMPGFLAATRQPFFSFN